MARYPNVYCKASGMFATDPKWDQESINTVVRPLFDIFGFDRSAILVGGRATAITPLICCHSVDIIIHNDNSLGEPVLGMFADCVFLFHRSAPLVPEMRRERVPLHDTIVMNVLQKIIIGSHKRAFMELGKIL